MKPGKTEKKPLGCETKELMEFLLKPKHKKDIQRINFKIRELYRQKRLSVEAMLRSGRKPHPAGLPFAGISDHGNLGQAGFSGTADLPSGPGRAQRTPLLFL